MNVPFLLAGGNPTWVPRDAVPFIRFSLLDWTGDCIVCGTRFHRRNGKQKTCAAPNCAAKVKSDARAIRDAGGRR